MLCFRTAFCGDTVSQCGGSELGHLSLLRVPCPLLLEEGVSWQVPGLGVPVAKDETGQDGASPGLSQDRGSLQHLSHPPAPRAALLGTRPPILPEEGGQVCPPTHGAGQCPGSYPHSMLAPQQRLMPAQALQTLHTPHWHQLSRMRAARDAFDSECQGKG